MKKFVFILTVFIIGLGGYFFYSNVLNTHTHKLNLHRVVKNEAIFEKWTSFDPKEENFVAFFPKKPEMISRSLPIPGSNDFLPYKEFKCEVDGNRHFSVSYTTLPTAWTKYGNSLVLGGALRVIMHELGKVELVGKESFDFKSFPALDYEHYSPTTGSAGSLVLVGNTLYKVEMSYPLEKHDEIQDELSIFIENFTPTLDLLPSRVVDVEQELSS